MKLFKVLKAAKGDMGIDEMMETLSSLGVDVKLDPIPMETKPVACELEAIAELAVKQGSKFYRMSATGKTGGPTMVAFMVLTPN